MVNDNIINLYLLNLAFIKNNEKIINYINNNVNDIINDIINNSNSEVTQEDENFIIDLFNEDSEENSQELDNNDEENNGE